MVAAVLLASALAAPAAADRPVASLQSLLEEESPDVFLAKATLQQYLSRVVRQDWDAARRLTHPKTLAAIGRRGGARHGLAFWSDDESRLKTFRFARAREVSAGVVLIQVGEDNYLTGEERLSVDSPAVYLLFKSRGGFLVADRKPGIDLSRLSDRAVLLGYPGYLDQQVRVQARRESALFEGRHR
jgi:hypothetical protein